MIEPARTSTTISAEPLLRLLAWLDAHPWVKVNTLPNGRLAPDLAYDFQRASSTRTSVSSAAAAGRLAPGASPEPPLWDRYPSFGRASARYFFRCASNSRHMRSISGFISRGSRTICKETSRKSVGPGMPAQFRN